MPLLSGLSTGVKQGSRLSATAMSIVLWAAKIDPLSESHCTRCGAGTALKRLSTQWTIMSRIISPEMPAVVAIQPITSRSWQSSAKATRTTSPFQQVNSSASEHQRTFERIVATWPSCSRGRRRPVWRSSVSPCFFINRKTRLALTVDRSLAGGTALALEERAHPPIAVGRPLVDQATDVGGELDI